MTGLLSDKAKALCTLHSQQFCRASCPLAEACKIHPGDNGRIFADRMNAAAEKVEVVE